MITPPAGWPNCAGGLARRGDTRGERRTARGRAHPGTIIFHSLTVYRRSQIIDGALRAGTNADLAVGARVVIVAEPMAHVYGISSTAAGAEEVVRLVPDADAIEAFGLDITDLTAWAPAYRAGVSQAADAAERIRHTGYELPTQPNPIASIEL